MLCRTFPGALCDGCIHLCSFVDVAGDVGFDDREMMREASSIEDSLFQTPAPIGDASTLAAADDGNADATLTQQEKMIENDGFGDDDGLGTAMSYL